MIAPPSRKWFFWVLHNSYHHCSSLSHYHPQIATNGIEMHRSHDMMRMDSIILSIQLTIRRMLTQQGLPEINIICERMSKAVHLTRYEDQVRSGAVAVVLQHLR